MEPSTHKHLKLLITIVARGHGNTIVKECEKFGIFYHLSFMGHGTAPTKMLEYLGLANSDRDILFFFVAEDMLPRLLARLGEVVDFKEKGGGIAFTIPLSSIGGATTLKLIASTERGEYISNDK